MTPIYNATMSFCEAVRALDPQCSYPLRIELDTPTFHHFRDAIRRDKSIAWQPPSADDDFSSFAFATVLFVKGTP